MLVNVDLDHRKKLSSLLSTLLHHLLGQSAPLFSEMRVVAETRIGKPTVVRAHEPILRDS